MKVVKQYTVTKNETFRDIVLGGNRNDVLEFLRVNNLAKGEKGFTFADMLWMLKDKAFFI